MKLSRMIAFRESLDELPYAESVQSLRHDLQVCMDTFAQSPVDLDVHHGAILDVQRSIERDLENFRGGFDIIKRHLDREITRKGQAYFADSYRHYESVRDEPLEQMLDRELRLSDEGDRILRHRIKTNSNWQFPGVLIHPQRETYYTEMMDSDPLYLLDTDHDLLEPCLSSVSSLYRARLRRGIIDEGSDRFLSGIPMAQIGFVFAWNFFNYRPVEVLKKYFHEIHEALRPGGRLLFTYNNCSRSIPVVLCEHAFASFTPDWAVISLLNNAGFQITEQYDGDYHLNFLEAIKTGPLATLRGGQTLATIISKPYTKIRMQELETQARDLEIDPGSDSVDHAVLEQEINRVLEQREEDRRLAEELRQLNELAEREARLDHRIKTLEEQIQEGRDLKRRGLETERQEQQRLQKEHMLAEIDRIQDHKKSVRDRAVDLNIPDRDTLDFHELEKRVQHAEEMKQLNYLRKEAVRLKIDRTDLIMRKYTAKELKRAIKKWRAENERPST